MTDAQSRGTELSKYFDHTLLKATASQQEIAALCQEALDCSVYAVCVNPCHLEDVVRHLQGSDVKPITVVGFPLGANHNQIKLQETEHCLTLGAREIDLVLNIGRLIDQQYQQVQEEIAGVVRVSKGIPCKVIIETAYLSIEQIQTATKICADAGARFVKTSTGFASRGASVEDITLIKQTLVGLGLDHSVGIKASGGIKTWAQAQALIAAGATRLGASSTPEILQQANKFS